MLVDLSSAGACGAEPLQIMVAGRVSLQVTEKTICLSALVFIWGSDC